MAIEIVDLPTEMVIFHSYVGLPAGRAKNGGEKPAKVVRKWDLVTKHDEKVRFHHQQWDFTEE